MQTAHSGKKTDNENADKSAKSVNGDKIHRW